MTANRELGLHAVYPNGDGRVVLALGTPSGSIRYVSITPARALRLAAELMEAVAKGIE